MQEGRISYKEYGSGDDVIILVHGFLSSSRYWNKLTPYLVKGSYRVVTINLLGFGDAKKPNDIEYNYDDQIKYLKAIIDHLKLSKPFSLVGHSMGALIVARYATLYPHNLKTMILLHPPLYRDTDEAQYTLISTGKVYRYLLDSKYRDIGWKLLRSLLPRIIASHTNYSREQSMQSIILKAELFTDLEKITTRTLLLIGLHDRPIYQYNLRSMSVNANVRVIQESVNHHSPIKHPYLVQRYITDFISEITY